MKVKQVQYFNDSIASSNDPEKYKKIKQERVKKEKDHNEFIKYKQEYEFKDSKEYPGFIFCDENIIKFYKINSESLKEIIQIENNGEFISKRTELLKNSSDKGEFFLEFKKRLDGGLLAKYKKEKEEFELSLFKMFKDLLISNLYIQFENTIGLINEYLKNKKNPYKVYVIKEKLSFLQEETSLNISKFFSIYWNLPELLIPLKKTNNKNKGVYLQFDYQIDSLNDFYSKINNEEKWIVMTNNDLKNKIIEILLNTDIVNENDWKQKTNDDISSKWSLLTNEQKKDKLKSFCEYFIYNKKYIDLNQDQKENQNEINDILKLIENLYKVLLIHFDNKTLKYKQIRWNNVKKIIENIKGLELNLENYEFTLNIDKKSIKRKITKSKNLTKSKYNVEKINDFLLIEICNLSFKLDFEQKEFKEKNLLVVLEKIKGILNITRYINSDKEFIIKQYNDFYDIVLENKELF